MKKILLIISIVSLFQLQGSEAPCFDPAATKALFNAIRNENIEGIKRALEAGADPNEYSIVGNTPLTFAAESNIWQAVPLLVEKKVNINKQNRNDRTPLMIAAMYGHKEMVEALLKDGANIHIKANDGSTALSEAAPSIEILHMLLRAGANVNESDEFGRTPLITRAMYADGSPAQSKDAILFLLNAGADVAAKNKVGKKALDFINEAWKRSFNPRLEEIQTLLIDKEKEQQAALRDAAAAALSKLLGKKNSLIEKQIAKMIG